MGSVHVSIYPGKRDFEQFVANIPKDEKSLTQKELFALAINAAEIFGKGIPYSDRPYCLYLFYHFLGVNPVSAEKTDIDQFPELPEYAISSLMDPQILEYIKLLDADKLYEVCQIRGELKSINIGLIDVIKGTAGRNWDDISEDAETFLKSEPCLSREFLDDYLCAMNKNCADSECLQPRQYELAGMVWNHSTDENALAEAWATLNDVDVIRKYKKETLDPKEAKKVFNLERVEQEITTEFGDIWRGRTMLGKAFQMLTKEGREERKAITELRDRWYGDIKHKGGWSILGNDPYVKGYVAYLNAHVSGGTEDWKGAVKQLKDALEYGFDPVKTLSILIAVLDWLKKPEEAAQYAQQLIDKACITEDYIKNEKSDELMQRILLIFKQINLRQQWADRIWKTRAQENLSHIPSVISELSQQTKSARELNLKNRTLAGFSLLDRLVSLELCDEAINTNTSFSDVRIESPIESLLELSLEEINIFQKVGTEIFAYFYEDTLTLHNLLEYNKSLINEKWGNLAVNLDIALANFANTLACLPYASTKIASLSDAGQYEPAKRLVEHLLDKRTRKVAGLYTAIEPILQYHRANLEWHTIIAVCKKARGFLLEPEYSQATAAMIEAYVELLSNEKSLNEKDRLLQAAESEHLDDIRLSAMREEVDALLNRRRRIRNRILVVCGGLIVVAALLIAIFKDSIFVAKEHSPQPTLSETAGQRQSATDQSLQRTVQPTGQEVITGSAPSQETPRQQPPTSTSTVQWKIEVNQLFSNTGEPLISDLGKLITALEANSGEGTAVSRLEFWEMLKRPEAQIVYRDEIIKYATPASLAIQKKEHEDYTKIFMKESYQKAGLEFLRTQSPHLQRAEREYGVLQKDIVSILIWESGLGKFTGNFQEFNVFLGQILFLDIAQKEVVAKMVAGGNPNPLADPARAEKERTRLEKRKSSAVANLAALLRVCKQQGLDPFAMKGSWGGAIGSVQFMPVNLKYAIDGDSDGKVNLSQWPDAIMSVANYLKVLGKYDTSEAGRNRAILRYNPSKEYAAGVMLLADTIWQRHLNGE